MNIALGLLVVVGIAAVFMFTRLAKKRVLGTREDIADGSLVELFNDVALPSATTLEVLKQVGACYGIAYTQLRPDDCLITRLSKIDSWSLDAGAEKLEKWLRDKFGVAVPRDLKTFTVLDLLRLVESTRGEPASQPGER